MALIQGKKVNFHKKRFYRKKKKKNYGKRGKFYSQKNKTYIEYKSSYELAYIKILEKDNSVISYEYEPIVIEFYLDGKKRRYVPDFVVNYGDLSDIHEVKPKRFLKHKLIKYKAKMARQVIKENDNFNKFKFITEKDLFYKKNKDNK
jgi:hypothetical protein